MCYIAWSRSRQQNEFIENRAENLASLEATFIGVFQHVFTTVPNKQHILHSIRAIARRLGRAPSLLEFAARARVSKYSVFRHFLRWNDAVRAAGLEPQGRYVRPGDKELLEDWGKTVRKIGTLPSRRAYRLKGQYDPRTIERRFGPWSSLPQAFRNFAKDKRGWAEVLALLPARVASVPLSREKRHAGNNSTPPIPPKAVKHAAFKDRATFGNPIDFGGLRHEPVNEQGVVLLFGMLARDLDYLIESIQNGFPDCEAKRRIAPERWQRVRIEFEFESKNFRDHGHRCSDCDVIVCWRHNWRDCPKEIEVLELSSIIKSLDSPEH